MMFCPDPMVMASILQYNESTMAIDGLNSGSSQNGITQEEIVEEGSDVSGSDSEVSEESSLSAGSGTGSGGEVSDGEEPKELSETKVSEGSDEEGYLETDSSGSNTSLTSNTSTSTTSSTSARRQEMLAQWNAQLYGNPQGDASQADPITVLSNIDAMTDGMLETNGGDEFVSTRQESQAEQRQKTTQEKLFQIDFLQQNLKQLQTTIKQRVRNFAQQGKSKAQSGATNLAKAAAQTMTKLNQQKNNLLKRNLEDRQSAWTNIQKNAQAKMGFLSDLATPEEKKKYYAQYFKENGGDPVNGDGGEFTANQLSKHRKNVLNKAKQAAMEAGAEEVVEEGNVDGVTTDDEAQLETQDEQQIETDLEDASLAEELQKTPDMKKMETVVMSAYEAGKLNLKEAKAILDQHAKKIAATMKGGAEAVFGSEDEEGLLDRIFGAFYGEEDEDSGSEKSNSQKSDYRNGMLNASVALKEGKLAGLANQQTAVVYEFSNEANQTYQGNVEEGLKKHNRLFGKKEKMSNDHDDEYDSVKLGGHLLRFFNRKGEDGTVSAKRLKIRFGLLSRRN